MKIQALEREKSLIYNDGECRICELYQESKEKLRQFLLGGDYWRKTLWKKVREDILHANSYDAIMDYGLQQGELFEQGLYDIDNA